jgi:hypothetical protein
MATAERIHPKQRMSFEEAARLDADEQPGEIVDGAWVPMTRDPWHHGEVVLSIGVLLKHYARSHPGWNTLPPGIETGTTLSSRTTG